MDVITGKPHRTMVTWVFLILIMAMFMHTRSQYSICPPDRGIYYATGSDCIIYYRCVNRTLEIAFCLPWERFDVHSMECKNLREVDCNPEFGGIWRPIYDGEMSLTDGEGGEGILMPQTEEGTNEETPLVVPGIVVPEEGTEGGENMSNGQGEQPENGQIGEGQINEQTHETNDGENQNPNDNGNGNGQNFNNGEMSNDSNKGESSGLESESLMKSTPQPINTEGNQEDSSGGFWFWCGSGRFVYVRNDENRDNVCLQLPDPQFINEESTSQQVGGDWAGHTFLGREPMQR